MRTLLIVILVTVSMNSFSKVNDRDFILNGQLEAYDSNNNMVYFERNIKDKNSIFENVSNEEKLFNSIEEQNRIISKLLKCKKIIKLYLEDDRLHSDTLYDINNCKK